MYEYSNRTDHPPFMYHVSIKQEHFTQSYEGEGAELCHSQDKNRHGASISKAKGEEVPYRPSDPYRLISCRSQERPPSNYQKVKFTSLSLSFYQSEEEVCQNYRDCQGTVYHRTSRRLRQAQAGRCPWEEECQPLLTLYAKEQAYQHQGDSHKEIYQFQLQGRPISHPSC